MKKNVLTKSLFAALLLASNVVVAEEYPATDYQPEVVYSDNAAVGSQSSDAKTEKEAPVSSATTEAKAEKAESSSNMLVGLVVLAVAGGFFLSKKNKAPVSDSESSASATRYSGDAASGQTGVERYLQAQNASAGTGVEKYLARKEVADKEASLTGVDKYLRNRS